jgi:hypothetical protein
MLVELSYVQQLEAQLHSQHLEYQHLQENVTEMKLSLQSELQAVEADLRTDIERLKEAIDDVSATSAAEQECTILRIDDIAEQVSHASNGY